MADNDDLSTTAISGSNAASAPRNERWTCEACGCRTNTEMDDPNSCGVCGTHRIIGKQSKE